MRIVDAAFEPSAYIEQLRSGDLSFGTYLIPAGGTDDQSPHAEDEIYVVTRGRAKIVTPGETVDPGFAGGSPRRHGVHLMRLPVLEGRLRPVPVCRRPGAGLVSDKAKDRAGQDREDLSRYSDRGGPWEWWCRCGAAG